ncbi:TPA: tail fiber assembly protein [Yersinia enterocolitica]|nr:tail fiber assembly protein [Yersinia enterocolitica]
MKALFSPVLATFIPDYMAVDGSYPPEVSDSLITVTDEELATYWRQEPPEGKTLGVTNSRPVWVNLPPPTPEQLAEAKAINVAQAKADKSKLISAASDKIEILKDRIDAGQDKAAELKLWKAYRIALDDVDINDPVWPVVPE